MTVEQLTALAGHLLAFGSERVREKHGLHSQFHLVCPDGRQEVIVVGGDIANWADAKSELSKRLKTRMKELGAVAILLLSDTWYAAATPEQAALKQRLGLGVSEMAELGLMEAWESVFVSLESPVILWTGHQRYKRNNGHVELVGEPVIKSSAIDPSMRTGGRFGSFFTQQQGPTQ